MLPSIKRIRELLSVIVTPAGGDKVLTNNGRFETYNSSGGITNSAPANTVPKSDGTNLVSSQITDSGTSIDVTTPVDGRFRAGDLGAAGNGVVLRVDDADSEIELAAPSIFVNSGANGEVVLGDTQGAGPFIQVDPSSSYIDIDPQAAGELHLGHNPTQIRVRIPDKNIIIDTPAADGLIDLNALRVNISDVLKLAPQAFASLPASPEEGDMAWVNDSNTATWGDTVAGGGANKVLVVYNGTNWTVAGK